MVENWIFPLRYFPSPHYVLTILIPLTRWKSGYFPDYQPDQIDGPGDGTVNQPSLELCKQFKRLKAYRVYQGIKEGEHMQILLNPKVIEFVKDILNTTSPHESGDEMLHF